MLSGRTGTLGAVLVSVLLVSCKAVTEDRRECPCTLSVKWEAQPAYPAALYVNGRAAARVQRDTVLRVWVEKGGMAAVTAVSGAEPDGDMAVRIPYGLQAPALYAQQLQVDCRGEQARTAVHMRKHFCLLEIRFSQPPDWLTAVAIRGSANGFSLAGGRPLEGPFYCRLDGMHSCRIPRHRPGDPLWLDLVLEDRVLRSFPLGTYLEAAGYDWTAADLADISLEVDISVTDIGFHFDEWSRQESLEIII